jgi:threonine/homoserine efflux transporter RhtA
MDDDAPLPGVTVEQRRVHQASLIRAAAVCAIWLATWPLRHASGEIRLGLDLALAAGGWWAILPGRRTGGHVFGEHGHWSSLVIALPIGFGIAAAAELWHLLRSAG